MPPASQDLNEQQFWGTHAFVVFKRGTLQDEIARFPAAEVLAALGVVPFLVPCLGHRFVGLADHVRGEECNDFILVLHREGDE